MKLVVAVIVGLVVLGVLVWAGAGTTASQVAIAALTTVVTGAVGYFVKFGLDRATTAMQSQEPLEVTLETDPSKISTFQGGAYEVFLPRAGLAAAAPSPPPEVTAFHDWAAARGAAASGTAMLRLIVQAKNAPVVLSSIRAHVVSRETIAPDGVVLERPTAGAASIRRMAVDLDRDDATLQWQRRSGRVAPTTFTLEANEVEIFDITATLTGGAVRWVLVLDYVVGGRNLSRTVPTDGHLELVIAANSPRYVWDWRDGWARDDGTVFTTAELFRAVTEGAS